MSNYPNSILNRKYITQKGETNWELELTTKSSVQLGKEYQRWYPNGKKIIPRDIVITPTLVLHFYIGDGSYNNRQLIIYTNDFSKEDVIFLSEKLNATIGINSYINIVSRPDRTNKIYYVIAISTKESLKKFFDYIAQAYPESILLAKAEFPWKFSGTLRRRDVLKEKEKIN